jgi:hypothetical protein
VTGIRILLVAEESIMSDRKNGQAVDLLQTVIKFKKDINHYGTKERH